MRLWIRHGDVVDVRRGVFRKNCDVLCENGKIIEVGPLLSVSAEGTQIIDARDHWVSAGLIDGHAQLCDPGFPEQETIASGVAAAKAGGFTGLVCTPNTDPVLDCGSLVEYILIKGYAKQFPIYPLGALTQGLKGLGLSEMGDLIRSGVVGFADTGCPTMNSDVLRKALEYAKMFHCPVALQCQDAHLVEGGVIHESPRATVLGLKGIPRQAENIMVARNIALAELAGCAVHLQLISTKESVALIADAKKRGLPVTAETAPWYFSFSCEEGEPYDTRRKLNPPLREKEDCTAIRQAVKDGVIDIIVSAHVPCLYEEKELEYERAPFGAIGLETVLAHTLTELVNDQKRDNAAAVLTQMSWKVAQIFGLANKGAIEKGYDADITIINPQHTWVVKPEEFLSLSDNTPLTGLTLKGKASHTIIRGAVCSTVNN